MRANELTDSALACGFVVLPLAQQNLGRPVPAGDNVAGKQVIPLEPSLPKVANVHVAVLAHQSVSRLENTGQRAQTGGCSVRAHVAGLQVAMDDAGSMQVPATVWGICGGWHLSGVCMYVFLVLGTTRGAAGRVFPAMLRARESGVLRTPESGLQSPTPGVQESLQAAAAVVAVCRGGEARAGGRRAELQRMHRGARPQCRARVYRRVGQGRWCVLWLECSSAVQSQGANFQ